MDLTPPPKQLSGKRNHRSEISREFQSLWHWHIAFRSIVSILGAVQQEKPITLFLVQAALTSSPQQWGREGEELNGGESTFFPPSLLPLHPLCITEQGTLRLASRWVGCASHPFAWLYF